MSQLMTTRQRSEGPHFRGQTILDARDMQRKEKAMRQIRSIAHRAWITH